MVGQRRRLDEIAAADFDAVDARHLRGAIDQALDQVDRLRPPGAAIDRGRGGVGEDGLRAELDRLHVVDARNQHEREEQRRRDRGPPIGAERLIGPGAQPPGFCRRRRARARRRPPGRAPGYRATATSLRVAVHFTGRPSAARRPEHEHVVGIEVRLHAEAAADVGRDHADLGFGNMENRRSRACCAAHAGPAMSYRACNASLLKSPIAQRGSIALAATRLFSSRSDTTCVALAKAASVAALSPKAMVTATVAVRAVLPDLRRAGLDGVLQADHGRQRLVVDLDQLGGIARLRLGLRDDEGDTVADAAHAVSEQHRPHRAEALWAAPMLRHEVGRDAADRVSDRVGAGQHQNDAGGRPRRRDVDALDPRVGMGRQHRDAMALPRQLHVADIRALPRQEALVLDSTNSLTDAERYHRHLLVMLLIMRTDRHPASARSRWYRRCDRTRGTAPRARSPRACHAAPAESSGRRSRRRRARAGRSCAVRRSA